jgi:hypothetical protein
MNQAVNETLKPPPTTGGEAGTIDIPDSVVVRCPMADFKLRRTALRCPECPHFHGFADRFPESKAMPAAKRYLVLCGEPIPAKRELFELEDA